MAELLLVLLLFGAVIALVCVAKEDGKSSRRRTKDNRSIAKSIGSQVRETDKNLRLSALSQRLVKDHESIYSSGNPESHESLLINDENKPTSSWEDDVRDDWIIEGLIKAFHEQRGMCLDEEREKYTGKFSRILEGSCYAPVNISRDKMYTERINRVSGLLVFWEWSTSPIESNGGFRKSLIYAKIAEKISSQVLIDELDEDYIQKKTVTLFLLDCFRIGDLDQWEIFALKSLLAGRTDLLQSSRVIPPGMRYKCKSIRAIMQKIIRLINDFEKEYIMCISRFISQDAEHWLRRLGKSDGERRWILRKQARLDLERSIKEKLNTTSSLPVLSFRQYLLYSARGL